MRQYTPEAAEDFLLRLPRGWRLFAVDTLSASVTRDQLRALLVRWWIDTESPSHYGNEHIVRLFTRAGCVTDTAGDMRPTGRLTVYRGVGASGEPRGVSWTLDEDRASWFARRLALEQPGTVYAAEVELRHVLGVFHDRT